MDCCVPRPAGRTDRGAGQPVRRRGPARTAGACLGLRLRPRRPGAGLPRPGRSDFMTRWRLPQAAFFGVGAPAYAGAGLEYWPISLSWRPGRSWMSLGDIGSTMAAYSAYLSGQTDLTADAITISPFLGFDPRPGRGTGPSDRPRSVRAVPHQQLEGGDVQLVVRRRPQRGSADGRRR